MEAVTDHYVAKLGDHHLVLREVDGDGTHIVTARRDPDSGTWTVSASGVPDATHTAVSVHDVVDKHIPTHAIAHLGEHPDAKETGLTGYSTWVPHEVRKMDGDASWRAWCASVGLNPDTA